jgi:hypothetical protein
MAMRRFWWSVAAVEALAIVGFCFAMASSDYFVRMPPSVRHGASVLELVVGRALWLAGIAGVLNVSMWAWIKGVQLRQRPGPPAAVVFALVASVAFFVLACVLLVAFVLFGFPQY